MFLGGGDVLRGSVAKALSFCTHGLRASLPIQRPNRAHATGNDQHSLGNRGTICLMLTHATLVASLD